MQEQTNELKQKATYSTPDLRLYGDLLQVTQTVGNGGTVLDGGSGAFKKTKA